MTQTLLFACHPDTKGPGGFTGPSVSSDLSCPVWGCFAVLLTPQRSAEGG